MYSGSGAGTYYYDVHTSCPQDGGGYAENQGYPACTSYTPGPNQQTMQQIGSNNIVAIGQLAYNAPESVRQQFCGKKVSVFYNGQQVAAPDGGDFFVWDGCQACADTNEGRLDFSVSGLRDVNPNACNLGVVPGITWQIEDVQIKQFVP